MAHLGCGAFVANDCIFGSRVVVLDVDHSGRARLHVLGLEHLLLEVLAVPELVVLHGEAEAGVVIVAHAHMVLVMRCANWVAGAALD